MPTFADFIAACKVFQNDHTYSGETKLTVFAPWEEPPWGHDGLTQIPDNLIQGDVVYKLRTVSTIIISCTDKDMLHSAWERESLHGNVWTIAVAGGVVQPEGERTKAMLTIADWLVFQANNGNMPKLGRVVIMGHNETCGAIKKWNDERPLIESIKTIVRHSAVSREFEENEVVKALVRHNAKPWIQFSRIPGVMVNLSLFDLQRDGYGRESRLRPFSIDDFTLSISDLQHPEKIKTIFA